MIFQPWRVVSVVVAAARGLSSFRWRTHFPAIHSSRTEQLHCPAHFQLDRESHPRAMDYGLAGNIRLNAAEEQLHIDPAIETPPRTDIDDSQISLLELEIEGLSLDLEKEKKKSSVERDECKKHLQDLEDAEGELLRCQTTLQENEQRLAEALVEVRDKSEELADAEEELVWCRQRIGELEQQQTVERNQQEGILDTN